MLYYLRKLLVKIRTWASRWEPFKQKVDKDAQNPRIYSNFLVSIASHQIWYKSWGQPSLFLINLALYIYNYRICPYHNEKSLYCYAIVPTVTHLTVTVATLYLSLKPKIMLSPLARILERAKTNFINFHVVKWLNLKAPPPPPPPTTTTTTTTKKQTNNNKKNTKKQTKQNTKTH